jgi:cell division protein FtsL
MSAYITISNSKTMKRGIRKKTLPRNFKIGPVTFVVIAVGMFAFIGFIFLAQLFQSSTKGYEITELRQAANELKEENKKLEIKAAELRSFENIDESLGKLNMVKSDNVVYLKKTGGTIVAANR